jgi:hypothetical protein
MHPAQLFLLFAGKLGLLSSQLSFGSGNGHAFPCAHTDQVDFKPGEGGQDIEEHLPHRIGRIVYTGSKRQLYPEFNEPVGDLPGLGNGSCQAI